MSQQREKDIQKSVSVSVQKCGACRCCSSPPFPCEVWAVLALCPSSGLPASGSLELG